MFTDLSFTQEEIERFITAMYEKCDYYETNADGSRVYEYSYYKNKEIQNKETAQKILDDVKRRLVFEKVLTSFEDTGNGAELKEGMDAATAGKALKKLGYYFGKLSLLKQTLYYADDFEYQVDGNKIDCLCLEDAGLLVTKLCDVESYDSGKDFSNEDKNESYTVYTKPFTVGTDGEKEEYELLYAVDGTVPLFGGNKGWYYGMWNAEKDFSIALFEGEGSAAQNEDDFENKRNRAKDSQSAVENGSVTEADGESKVYYLAARKNEEVNEDGTVSVIMTDNALTGESSLKNALIGSFCSIETEDEKGNAVTLNYASYIKENIIHTERYGGSAYYEACEIGEDRGDGSFYMTNLRHTVTNGEDTSGFIRNSASVTVDV